MKYGLKDTSIQKIRGVFARYPQVEKAVLYGSRAKGNYKNGSDIDLTLRGGADLALPCCTKSWTKLTTCSCPTRLTCLFTNKSAIPM